MKLYEQVATNLTERIEQGYYSTGQKLPSIRATSQEHGVSISTTQEAYGLLVDNGSVEARPKSGYYVLEKQQVPELPHTSRPIAKPQVVTQWQKILQMLYGNDNREKTVQLNRALPDLNAPTLKPLLKINTELSRSQWRRILDYDHLQGSIELRHQVARLTIDSGCRIHPDEIVITTGCQEALSSSLRALTEPGDIVLVDSPIFFGSLQAIEMNGLKALEIPTNPETGISLEALELALEQWPVKVCLLNPTNNNPLGYSMPDENKVKLLALLKKYDLPLIEDDIYGDLSYKLPRTRTIKSFDTEGRVILCSSFSKTLATGFRVGWVIPGQYIEKIIMMKYISSMSTPVIHQLAIAEFIAQGYYEKHLRKSRSNHQRDRDIMIGLLKRYMPDGTRISFPPGGYLLWIEMPKKIDSVVLQKLALDQNISIAPGPFFSASGKYQNFIRLNCIGSGNPIITDAIKTLGELCQSMLPDS